MNGFSGLTSPDFLQEHHSRLRYFRVRLKRCLQALLIGAALMAMPACKGANERSALLAQQAEALLQAGDLPGAQKAIIEALALREDGPGFHQIAGLIALQSGNSVGAYRSFQNALDFDATNRTALAYVANIGVQIGQITEADSAADRLLTLEPNALPGLQAKGMVALSRNKFDDALQYGDRILAISPADEAGAIIKARALARMGKPEDAVKLIDQALLTSSNSAALLSNRVNLYRYLKQPAPMLAALDQLARQGNMTPAVELDRINLLYKLGQTDQAREAGLAFLEGDEKTPDVYATIQRIWWQYDRTPLPSAAARDSSRWKSAAAIILAARYTLARGDVAVANAVLASAPVGAQPAIASLKARVLAATGQQGEAQKQADNLLKADANDIDALLLKAQLASARNQTQIALEAAQLAQTNDPLNAEPYIILAGIYRREGQDWRARQIFEDGFKKLPQDFQLVGNYTQYLHQLGDKGRAMSIARAFARALPSSERAWEMFAAQCQASRDQMCLTDAQTGLSNAKTAYLVDEAPGAIPNRGLFGQI